MAATSSCRSKATSRVSKRRCKRARPIRAPFFDHLKDPAALRWTDLEKGHPVTRTIVVRGLDTETAGFPLVAQGARLRRERVGQQPKTVELITSRPRTALPQASWLDATIQHSGIETGLHTRLDASPHDDRYRLRERHGAHLSQARQNRMAREAGRSGNCPHAAPARHRGFRRRRIRSSIISPRAIFLPNLFNNRGGLNLKP